MDTYIASSSVAGNGLFAGRDFVAGEAVFSTSRPLVAALDNKRLSDTCANCFVWTAKSDIGDLGSDKGRDGVKACLGCRTLSYCSKQCQVESWKRTHKFDCKLLSKLSHKSLLPNAARAVLDMLQLSPRWEDCPFKSLQSHLNEITGRGGERSENLLVLSTGIHHYSGTKVPIEFVQSCFALIFTNTLTLWTPTFDPLGICLDPVAATANHSCEPNAITVFNGQQLSFRSLKPIKKDEEVFLSYVDVTYPYSHRQQELSDRFYFNCQCAKCQRGSESQEDDFKSNVVTLSEDMLSNLDVNAVLTQELARMNLTPENTVTSLPAASKPLSKIQTLANRKIESSRKFPRLEALRCLNDAMLLCYQTNVWPEHRQPLPSIRQEAFVKLLMDRSTMPRAFLQGMKLYFDVHPILYIQTFHPVRVIHKWTLAMLAIFLASEAPELELPHPQAKDLDFGVVIWGLLNEVIDNIQLSHGRDSTFARAVQNKMEEVKTDLTREDATRLARMKQRFEEQWKLLRRLASGEVVQSLYP